MFLLINCSFQHTFISYLFAYKLLFLAYFYTGSSLKGDHLWRTTRMVVNHLSQRGFKVMCIISDMGAYNRAMWKQAGIVSNRQVTFYKSCSSSSIL